MLVFGRRAIGHICGIEHTGVSCFVPALAFSTSRCCERSRNVQRRVDAVGEVDPDEEPVGEDAASVGRFFLSFFFSIILLIFSQFLAVFRDYC